MYVLFLTRGQTFTYLLIYLLIY